MCAEISRVLCQSEATVGLNLAFPGRRKNTFIFQEFQGALKLLVLALLLPPENVRRPSFSTQSLLLPLPRSDWDISTGIRNDACLTESAATRGIWDVSYRSAGSADESSEVRSQKTCSLFLAPLITSCVNLTQPLTSWSFRFIYL